MGIFSFPFRMFFALQFIIVLIYFIAPAQAIAGSGNNHKKLTDSNVRAFITETTVMTSNSSSKRSNDKVLSYLDEHIHPRARFKTLMKYIIPGYPVQETAMSLSKEEFMSHLSQGEASVEDYETSVDILSVKISKSKKKATVQTRNEEDAIMSVPTPDGSMQDVNVEGTSLCTQILTLNKNGVIQMFGASCVTDVEFPVDY